MASKDSERVLRRRPVHPEAEGEMPQVEREVEITELEDEEEEEEEKGRKGEEEEEEEEDPMVVKGSRPTGPPPETQEGEDDYWGVDDDDNWGGKPEPGKETQLQRKRRITRRTMTEMSLAFLVHLCSMCFYMYVHVYDATIVKRNKGKGFEGSELFGGRWKFLTYIDLWLQFGYFFLAFLTDIMPQSYVKHLFHKLCDLLFTTVVFPMAAFVVISFWAIYAIDREMIYPARLDEHIPSLLNHFWHTTIGICIVLELLLVFHRYPSTANAVVIAFIVATSYIIWIMTILTVADFWVYPFLQHMPPPLISVFFAFCYFFQLGLYLFGKQIAYWRWKERHTLMDELRM